MISIPDNGTLMPQMSGQFRLFPSSATDLMRLDLLMEAGSAYQPQKLCAKAANKLCTTATASMDAAALSEYMDYRGVVVEPNNDVLQSNITVYMLRRYAADVLPVVAEMLHCPCFTDKEFVTWQARQRQQILANEQRSSVLARRIFYEAIFGSSHPLGSYAKASDVDLLGLDTVRGYFAQRCTAPSGVILAGNVDDDIVNLLNNLDITPVDRSNALISLSPYSAYRPQPKRHLAIANSVQTTVRVGCIVPLSWDSADYAMLMLAVTALGGYFGSRLMSNLREDKGYTYGIYARTQIYRGTIVFYITADVAGGTAESAIDEIIGELRRLCDAPMEVEELDLVRTVMTGDFLRSVDGVFERAARHADMVGTDIDERFTDNLRQALIDATPTDIQRVARLCLNPENMTVCTAGA